jgi:dihydropteroate synthase
MGVLNVTPDSFYDGGRYAEGPAALAHALEMVEDGADWIDVGGESTRPGASPVAEAEELKRVLPIVEALAGKGITVSIDTTKAEVARLAIEAGAEIVNDVSALTMDPAMAGVVAGSGAGVCLMHMRGTPVTMQGDVSYRDLTGEVGAYLSGRLDYAVRCGIQADSIIVDPGIGFGKSGAGSLELIRNLSEFGGLGRPVLVGPSRKSFIGRALDLDVDSRLGATLVVSVAAVLNGAGVLRVHDVKEVKEAARMAQAIRDGIVERGAAPA